MQLVFLGLEEVEELADFLKDDGLLWFREFAKGRVEANAVVVGASEVALPVAAFGFCPGLDDAFVDGKRAIGDGEIHAEVDCIAKALAARTRTGGTIEAEQDGFRFVVIDVAELAGEFLVEAEAFLGTGVLEEDLGRFAIADFDGVDETLADVGRDGEAIGQDEDGLFEIDFQKRFGSGEFEGAAVLVEAAEPLAAQFEEARLQVFITGGPGSLGIERTSVNRRPAKAFVPRHDRPYRAPPGDAVMAEGAAYASK